MESDRSALQKKDSYLPNEQKKNRLLLSRQNLLAELNLNIAFEPQCLKVTEQVIYG